MAPRTQTDPAPEASPSRDLAVTTVTCPPCGQAFHPRRSDARYCSARCRKRALRRRQAKHRPHAEDVAPVEVVVETDMYGWPTKTVRARPGAVDHWDARLWRKL